MGDMGDDHFHEFIWKAAGRFVRDTGPWRRITEQAIDVGFASVPNDPHPTREVYPYGAEVRAIYAH